MWNVAGVSVCGPMSEKSYHCCRPTERHITPKYFAASMVRDLGLSPKFVDPIVASMTQQIDAFMQEVSVTAPVCRPSIPRAFNASRFG